MNVRLVGSIALALTLAACPPRPRRPYDGGGADSAEAPGDSAADATAGDADTPDGSDASASARDSAALVRDDAGRLVADEQTPPQTRAELIAWLAAGGYRAWDCQRAPRTPPAAPRSGHTRTRVCMNRRWIQTLASEEFPVGAAAVKELFDASDNLVGRSVMVKVRGENIGAAWYWYQRANGATVPAGHTPPEADGTVADGLGSSGNAQTLCATCHSLAGTDSYGTRIGPRYGYTTTTATE
jgi:hypothetical protein